MSDLDPVVSDTHYAELSAMFQAPDVYTTVLATDVPRIVALELRRQFHAFEDPSQYHLILRAQELESL